MAITIHLRNNQAQGLTELLYLAQQAREHYLQATAIEETAPGNEADRQAVENRWNSAQEVIHAIGHQATPGTAPLLDKLDTFLDLAEDWTFGEMLGNIQCVEAESLADLYRATGKIKAANQIIQGHAGSDYEEDDDHHHLYLQQAKQN